MPLTDKGKQEAVDAGKLLKEKGFTFNIAFTSVLQRAIKTYHTIADELDISWIPHTKHWRLNERHYGNLQGLNKAETAEKFGEELVTKWRRSYSVAPPELDRDDKRHPRFRHQYYNLPEEALPKTESLESAAARVMPFWYDTICPLVLDY